MEDNDYDLDEMEREAQRHADLFHVGKPLFEELNRLWSEGDQVELDEFFIRLNFHEQEALRYVAELNNQNIAKFEHLLKAGDRENTIEFLQALPRVFQKPIREVLIRHLATRTPSPPPEITTIKVSRIIVLS